METNWNEIRFKIEDVLKGVHITSAPSVIVDHLKKIFPHHPQAPKRDEVAPIGYRMEMKRLSDRKPEWEPEWNHKLYGSKEIAENAMEQMAKCWKGNIIHRIFPVYGESLPSSVPAIDWERVEEAWINKGVEMFPDWQLDHKERRVVWDAACVFLKGHLCYSYNTREGDNVN